MSAICIYGKKNRYTIPTRTTAIRTMATLIIGTHFILGVMGIIIFGTMIIPITTLGIMGIRTTKKLPNMAINTKNSSTKC